ncbi:MAG: type VI secretion system-associated FHA domain protein TagH [Micropepsaceae bacterium]
MRLTLKIENQDQLSNGQPLIRQLDRAGIEIGRAGDVDWQLPDPQKLISSIHAEIVFEGGVFLLRDRSRNGTYVNGARIDGAAREVQLRDGDRIAIGHYEISAVLGGDGNHLAHIDSNGGAETSIGTDFGWDGGDADVAPPEPVETLETRTPMGYGDGGIDAGFKPAVVGTSASGDVWGWDEDPPAALVPPPSPLPASPPSTRAAPPSHEAAPAPLAASMHEAGRALAAFLRGAAVPGDTPQAKDPGALEQAGITLRVLVTGLYDLLKRQGDMKQVLGIERTTVRLADNNIFKFSADADEAILRLMQPQTGDLPGPSAAQRSFDDIRRHEERLLTAMNEAVRSIVERLAPAAIKARDSGGRGIIPGSRKAAWWDELERQHAALMEENGVKLDELIEDELRDAFTRHL